MRQLLEGMGKTLFFRSGNTPLVLSHAQVESRKRGRQTALIQAVEITKNFTVVEVIMDVSLKV